MAAFSGSHRYVLDYLADEVLEGQTEQVREFLLETSVLDRLSGGLCDAVTGRAGGQVMLEQVERANLFLVPLDEVRGWWRYHYLFADLLRARLQQQQPGRVAALHHNAAAWCEEHGLADDAVRHALAAGDTTWAARLIERHFDETFWPGERATVQRWLSALPAELAGSRPRLCLVRAVLALAGGDAEGAGPLMDAAERASADAQDEPLEPSAGKAASLLVNVPAAIALCGASLAQLRGDADGTAAFASQAPAKTGEGESMLDSTARWLLAMAEWLRGRVAEAERGLRCQHHRMAGGGRALLGRLRLPSPRPGAAGPGPPRHCARHLPAGAGDHRGAGPAGYACGWDRLRRHGGGGLPAE